MGLLKPRTASVLVYHGDDMERLAELRRAVARAEARVESAAGSPRRGGDAVVSAEPEKAAYDAAVDEAAGRAVEVRLAALGSQRFRGLLAEHPPRDGVDDDAPFGVNTETFPRALLMYRDAEKRTITDPDCSVADLGEFLDDEASEGDFEELWVTAYWLNKATGVDPRLGKYSPATETSAAN